MATTTANQRWGKFIDSIRDWDPEEKYNINEVACMCLFYVEYQQSTPLTFTNPVFSNIFNCFLIKSVFWSLFVKYFAILSQSQCSISRSLNLAIAPFVDSSVSCCRRAVIHQATINTTPLKCNIPSLIFKVMAEWCITIANLMRHFVFFQTPGHSGLMCFGESDD